MPSSERLFDDLRNCQKPQHGLTPQQALFNYCCHTLGSVERLHFDYKEKADPRTPALSDDDRKNLAKAVSGFANSEGGVLIWGIQDATTTPRPIVDIQDFVANLQTLAVQSADPVVPNIDVDWIPADGSPENGFGLIHVPESPLPPHRVNLKLREIQKHYFIRSGGEFRIAEHYQLEDMFGRRPKPKLELTTRVVKHQTKSYTLVVGIKNEGRGAAHAPFLAVEVGRPYSVSHYGIDGNRQFGLRLFPLVIGSKEHQYGADATVVLHAGTELEVTAIDVPIPDDNFRGMSPVQISWRMAAEGVSVTRGQTEVGSDAFWREFTK